MTCETCEDLCRELIIQTPGNLWSAINVARQNVDDGAIFQVQTQDGSYTPIAKLNRADPMPDLIEMDFHCTRCGEQFHLVCENYHGAGGHWSYGAEKT
jgi:hypothetical protein